MTTNNGKSRNNSKLCTKQLKRQQIKSNQLAPPNTVPGEETKKAQRWELTTKETDMSLVAARSIGIKYLDPTSTSDNEFARGLVTQLIKASSVGGRLDEVALNFMLSAVKSADPQNHTEAILATQMAVVHVTGMKFLCLSQNEMLATQRESGLSIAMKLFRLYSSQIEALKRYQTGGEQKVTVRHVSVQDGGQAIVGNVTQASRERIWGRSAAAQPALTDARAAPMPIINAAEQPAPIPANRKDKK